MLRRRVSNVCNSVLHWLEVSRRFIIPETGFNKLPVYILARILLYLPRNMLYHLSPLSSKFYTLSNGMFFVADLPEEEYYRYLECIADMSVDKWLCVECLELHQYQCSDGPLSPEKSSCPKDLIRYCESRRKGCHSYLSLGRRHIQFVNKYHDLFGPQIRSPEQTALLNRILSKIHVIHTVHPNYPSHKVHLWFSLKQIVGRFYTHSVFKAKKIEKLEQEAMGSSLPIPRCCKHQEFNLSSSADNGDLRERPFMSKWGKAVYKQDDSDSQETEPSFPFFKTKPLENSLFGVVQTALRNHWIHYEGDCKRCHVKFGAMTSSSSIMIWIRRLEYQTDYP